MQKFGWDEQRADKFVREELRDALPVLRTRNGGKFILGVTRMFCGGQLYDGDILIQLNRTLELVASDAHINEYDRNINDMSAQELIDRFASARKEMGNKDREEVGALELQENNNYTIVRIDSFEQASQYGKYTSWCVTHNENMLDSYTSNGIGQFYFCLKNGFENVQEEKGNGCPLDEYGLSMVAVCVDGDGNLNTCTCRWNHDNGGNDHIMDTKQISQLIGRNFYEVFKPNNKWKNALETAMQRLANGERLQDIFSDVSYTNDGGLFIVELLGKENIIDKNRKLISPNLWFDYVYPKIDEKLIRVSVNGKYNFIDINGNLLSPNRWFDRAYYFKNGYCCVKFNYKSNFIDTNGNLVSPNLWFDYILDDEFKDGVACVILDFKKNLLKENGDLVSPNQWFESIQDTFHDGFAAVKREDKLWNFIDINGNLLCDNWYDMVCQFKEGIAIVRERYKENFINTEGKILFEQWYDSVSYFYEGFSRVELNDKYNFINKRGEILSPNLWFDWADLFNGGYAEVFLDYKTSEEYLYIDYKGKLHKNKEENESKSKRNIIITESQAFNLLFEAASLDDVYEKYYSQIPEEEFKQIVSADPTSGQDKMGKYSKWLLALYTGGNLKLEDLYKATQYLTTFHKYKAKLERKDIGQYKSLPDLYNAIQPYEDNTQAASHKEEIRQMKEGAEKVYEDENYLIVVPHTEEAAIFYGKGTQWCTAATNGRNYFNHYDEQGSLYININKKTGRKYQFHFPTAQFMDESDSPLRAPIAVNLNFSEQILDFYYSQVGDDVLYIESDYDADEIFHVNKPYDNLYIMGGTELIRFENRQTTTISTTNRLKNDKIKRATFEEYLILNRYLCVYDGSRGEYINIYDVKEDRFIFDNEEISKIRGIDYDWNYMAALSWDLQDIITSVFDLKTRDWLDSFGNYTTNIEGIDTLYGTMSFPSNLAIVESYDNGKIDKKVYAFYDMALDKMLTRFYSQKGFTKFSTYQFGSSNFKPFSLPLLFDAPYSENTAQVLFYDGTVYNKAFLEENFSKLIRDYLKERGLTPKELYDLSHSRYA